MRWEGWDESSRVHTSIPHTLNTFPHTPAPPAAQHRPPLHFRVHNYATNSCQPLAAAPAVRKAPHARRHRTARRAHRPPRPQMFKFLGLGGANKTFRPLKAHKGKQAALHEYARSTLGR